MQTCFVFIWPTSTAEWLCSFLYFILLFPGPVFTNLKIVGISDTEDVLSPGLNIFVHVGKLPFLPLLIPAHHYQQSREGEGKSEHGNFNLSFVIIKSPRNSPSGLEILTLLSVANSAFWMRIVDTTLRIPANRDLLQTKVFRLRSYWHL